MNWGLRLDYEGLSAPCDEISMQVWRRLGTRLCAVAIKSAEVLSRNEAGGEAASRIDGTPESDCAQKRCGPNKAPGRNA
jgi:hypothetical protein